MNEIVVRELTEKKSKVHEIVVRGFRGKCSKVHKTELRFKEKGVRGFTIVIRGLTRK